MFINIEVFQNSTSAMKIVRDVRVRPLFVLRRTATRVGCSPVRSRCVRGAQQQQQSCSTGVLGYTFRQGGPSSPSSHALTFTVNLHCCVCTHRLNHCKNGLECKRVLLWHVHRFVPQRPGPSMRHCNVAAGRPSASAASACSGGSSGFQPFTQGEERPRAARGCCDDGAAACWCA